MKIKKMEILKQNIEVEQVIMALITMLAQIMVALDLDQELIDQMAQQGIKITYEKR